MHAPTGLFRWRVLWILVFVVPLQASLSLQLMTKGPSHAHSGADSGVAGPHTPAQGRPQGFEWADSNRPLTTPSTERILAALRGKAHGSLNAFTWPASHGGADRDEHPLAHAHGNMQRHHHGSADGTVLPDPSSAVAPALETLGAHAPSMAWAPPAQPEPLRAASAPGKRAAPATQHWRSHVPLRPERPPRSRDEELSA